MAMGQKVLMEEQFEGQFPFSWLVKEAMDTHWEGAKTTAGHYCTDTHTCVRACVCVCTCVCIQVRRVNVCACVPGIELPLQ